MIFNTKKYKLANVFSIIFSVIISLVIAGSLFLLLKQDFQTRLIISILCIVILPYPIYSYFMRKYKRRKKILQTDFPNEWENFLLTNVAYYSTLNEEERKRFKQEVQIFIGEKLITGVETDIDDKCRLLVASSAIIPIFSFPEWEYDVLSEVLIYPNDFDENFNFDSNGGNILGMVGIGSCMVLSKPSLLHGFRVENDKTNVGIHEFIHKIDEEDGAIDGIPNSMASKKTLDEWREISKIEMKKIDEGHSDINPYALTNQAEFFAVTSEYFFENPESMEKKHPELYNVLKTIFKQDTKNTFKSVVKSMFRPNGKKIPRNAPCPCGSGKKYKKCCLNKKI